MKKLLLAAMFCIMGVVAANAQAMFVNYTHCDLSIQQICVKTNPCAKIPGPTVIVPAGAIIPVPFAPCPASQETMYLVCWVNCPGLCAAVSVSAPQRCPVPYTAPLPACAPCGPATVSADPTTGTVKVY